MKILGTQTLGKTFPGFVTFLVSPLKPTFAALQKIGRVGSLPPLAAQSINGRFADEGKAMSRKR